MFLIGWLIVIPILIDSCTIDEFRSRQIHHQVIFIGRILSLHRWSLDYPHSAFVWVSRVFQGENHLLEHYQWTQLQRPLYVIVDQIESCSDGTQLKYYDEKIFAVRLSHARFYSNIPPLSITLANIKYLDGKYSKKARQKKYFSSKSNSLPFFSLSTMNNERTISLFIARTVNQFLYFKGRQHSSFLIRKRKRSIKK